MNATTPAHSPKALLKQGRAQRKQVPRGDLARWSPHLRRRKPLDVLDKAMNGRLTELLPLKRERMASSPFVFFRGAVPVMAYDFSLTPHTGILNQICGDAHVQNLGSYTGEDGRLTFDINDFDETTCGPFEWDLKRMATSILLAGQDARIRPGARRQAAAACLDAYSSLIATLAPMPVMDVARYKVHGLGRSGTVSRILRQAERATPLHSLEQLTELRHGKWVFRSNPPLLRRILGEERQAVLASIELYRESLAPERQHFLDQFRPLDVAFKIVGTGSIGLRDYCILFEGNGPNDPFFLQLKQETGSAYAPYLHLPPRHRRRAELHQGQRVVNGQHAMQFQSDPMLGWTSIRGEEFIVRQLKDHKATLDCTTLDAAGLTDYAEVCGKLLAHGHARSGDARLIAGYIGKGRTFHDAILNFAMAYAQQTVEDWKLLRDATSHPPLPQSNLTSRK